MNDDLDTNLPPDADDLSKHAPALFALKGTETGLVVPALYFEELSELVISKTAIPEDGGLVVPENYFEELTAIVEAKTVLSTFDFTSTSLSTSAQSDNLVPENYFEQLPSIIEAKTALPSEDGLIIPEKYFEEFAANLESQIALESALPKAEGEIPEGYFTQLESELNAHIALDNLKQDEGFVVPEKYFEKITDRILDVNTRVRLSGAEVDANAHDQVPEDYFDSLQDKVLARIETETREEKGRVIVFSQWKKYAAVTAVAASVALLIAFALTFSGNENGNGTLLLASNSKSLVPENDVKVSPQSPIDSAAEVKTPVADGIAAKTPKKPEGIKPKSNTEVIMSNDDILAQTDVMDEAMVMEFVAENGAAETPDEVLDEAMREYLMNDNSGFEIFVPTDKK